MDDVTILALWATPRTVSTAFERMMIERRDHLVLDEPWSRAYYFGPERRSTRYPLTFPESTFAAVEAGVLAAGSGRAVFVKDMAYHAAPGITDEALAAMSHTFLIRDPAAALASLQRRWPDVTDDEAGYRAQQELFERVVAVTGSCPPVIDSDRLRADPDRVIRRWCDRVGLEHLPRALRWRPGMRPEWPLWRDWYAGVAETTGFLPPGGSPTPDDTTPDDTVGSERHVDERMLAEARAAYAALADHAIG